MTARHAFSTALVASFVGGFWAAPAFAQQPAGQAGRPLDIYKSLQHAVAQATAERPVAKTTETRGKASADNQSSNGNSGSGGGHSKMIIGLVTAAAGIGATVYAVHQMQKTEDTLTATPHRA